MFCLVAGEIVQVTKEGVKSMCMVPRPGDQRSALCIFEYVYFSRPDTLLEGNHIFVRFCVMNTPVLISFCNNYLSANKSLS